MSETFALKYMQLYVFTVSQSVRVTQYKPGVFLDPEKKNYSEI